MVTKYVEISCSPDKRLKYVAGLVLACLEVLLKQQEDDKGVFDAEDQAAADQGEFEQVLTLQFCQKKWMAFDAHGESGTFGFACIAVKD